VEDKSIGQPFQREYVFNSNHIKNKKRLKGGGEKNAVRPTQTERVKVGKPNEYPIFAHQWPRQVVYRYNNGYVEVDAGGPFGGPVPSIKLHREIKAAPGRGGLKII